MIGNLAISLAGHDRNEIYFIIIEESEYVYLCDGHIRTLANMKKKNRKHIQVIKKGVDETVAEKIKAKEPVTDEQIKRAIKMYELNKSKQI